MSDDIGTTAMDPDPMGRLVLSLKADLAAAEAERDRLRAVVAAVAICGTCNYCQRRARAALDGTGDMGGHDE